MGFANRLGWAVHPKGMLQRERMRNEAEKLAAETEAIGAKRVIMSGYLNDVGVVNSGYGNGGASKRKTWALEYNSESGSPKRDIEENRKTLRERTRDLAMNAPLGAAAIHSTRTNVIGAGLIPVPRIDYDFLGIRREEAQELERQIKREFRLWAASTFCDSNDQNNFYELQQIAFLDWLKNGEEFILIKYGKETPNMPYQLRLKLVEADRVSTEHSYGGEYSGIDKKLKNGNTVVNGIEMDKNGRVVAYWISSVHPGEYSVEHLKWDRITKRGEKTGNPNVLHVYNAERADQYRGVPFLAPVIQALKQLTRYTESEIMAAVVNSLFTVFVTTESGNNMGGFGGAEEEEDAGDNSDEEPTLKLGNGVVNELKEGESVQTVESTHPSGNFDAFVSSLCASLGAALEISPEILLKKFSNNFSASKGALNETWKAFQMRRGWFVNDFCQPVYELWFNEAVSKGRIKAPGYFNEPLIKSAYTNAKWNGPSQGYLNPLQEVNAAVVRMENGLSTHEDECSSMNGGTFEDNIRTLSVENQLLSKANGGGGNTEKKEDENDKN